MPNEEFELPEFATSNGNFFKLKEDWSKKIRILSSGWLGYEIWVDKKPIRDKDINKLPATGDVDQKWKPTTPKEIWLVGLYNITDKQLQIWACNLISVKSQIKELSKNPDWGNVTGYDLTITKKTNWPKTEYIVTPSPLLKLPDEELEVINWHWFDWSEFYVDASKVISEKESKF